MKTQPDYSKLDEALTEAGSTLHPSELHGLICGMLVSPKDIAEAWQEVVKASQKASHIHSLVEGLYQLSKKQLEEFLFEFNLVLPHEEQPLPLRAEAITLWSQGFLTGLKLVHIPIENRDESECTEAIEDIIEIAKMNYEEVMANEEDESAYTEIVEYVRMAAILIYQAYRDKNSSPAVLSSPSHHIH
jgi:yecA family protein